MNDEITFVVLTHRKMRQSILYECVHFAQNVNVQCVHYIPQSKCREK